MVNPYQFDVTCDICGGLGVGTINTAAAAWDTDAEVRHINPNDCRQYLKQRAQELEKRESNASKNSP